MKLIREFLKLFWPDLDENTSNFSVVSAFVMIVLLIIAVGYFLSVT